MRRWAFSFLALLLLLSPGYAAVNKSFILITGVANGRSTNGTAQSVLVRTLATVRGKSEWKAVITVHNPNSVALRNYQIRVDLSSVINAVGHSFALRDADGRGYPYCFEQPNGECGTAPSSVIWVKVSSIPAGGTLRIGVIPAQGGPGSRR